MNPIVTKNRFLSGRAASAPVMLLAGLVLAACAIPQDRSADPRQVYPLTVSSQPASLSVQVTEEGDLSSLDEEFLVRHFVRDYLNRGRGQFTIEVNAGNRATAFKIAEFARKLGIPATRIETRYGGTASSTAVLGYVANTVDVPECGDWSKDEIFNWDNSRSPNFGCAMRRNLGLMVTNPGDLVRSRPASGHSANRAAGAIDTYNNPPAADATTPIGGAAAPAANTGTQ